MPHCRYTHDIQYENRHDDDSIVANWGDGHTEEIAAVSVREYKLMMSAPIGRKPPLWQSGDDPNGIVYKIVMSADRHMLYRLLRSGPGDKFRHICQVRVDHFGDDEESQQKTLAEFIKIGVLCFEGKCDDVYRAREAIFSTARCGKRPVANVEEKQHGHDERHPAMPNNTTWSANSIDS